MKMLNGIALDTSEEKFGFKFDRNSKFLSGFTSWLPWKHRRTEEVDSMWRDSIAKSGPRPKQLVAWKRDERSQVSEVPSSKPFAYRDTLPLSLFPTFKSLEADSLVARD